MSDSRLLPGSYECLIFENEPTTQNVEIEQLHEQVQRQGRQLRTQTVVLAACGLAVMLIAILLLTHRQILTGGSK